MKKTLVIAVLCAMTTAFGAPGNGKAKGRAPANTASTVSNAPAGTPHASVDRDLGRERALDAGKGKKKGLRKTRPSSVRANRSK